MHAAAVRCRIRPMRADDIAQVMDIERHSFPSMWPQTIYQRELKNKMSRYLVAYEPTEAALRIIGHIGVLFLLPYLVVSSGLSLFETSQVHGTTTHVLDGASVAATRNIVADALLALEAGDVVGVRTADCVPVLVADPATGAALAIHAGWRGTVGKIVSKSGLPNTSLKWVVGVAQCAIAAVATMAAKTNSARSRAAVIVPPYYARVL